MRVPCVKLSRNKTVQPSSKYIESTDLQRAENIYRARLRSQPEDMALRLSLAWCLFMQALHRSGQEAVHGVYALAYINAPSVDMETLDWVDGRSANALLTDCLQQTYTVKHLSMHEEERVEVARLHALVELAGAQDVSTFAEEQCMQRLVELAREAMRPAEG